MIDAAGICKLLGKSRSVAHCPVLELLLRFVLIDGRSD